MIGVPLAVEASNVTTACPLPASATGVPGVDGLPAGVTGADGVEVVVPCPLLAVTVKVYVVPLVRPLIAHE